MSEKGCGALVLIVLGSAAILMGTLASPHEEYIIVPGSAMIALGAYLAQAPGRRLVYCAFLIMAVSISVIWGMLSLSGGVTGWWQLLFLLYLAGWLMDIVGVPYMLTGLLKEPSGFCAAVIWILVASPIVLFGCINTCSVIDRRLMGFNGGFEMVRNGLPANWYLRAPEGNLKHALDTENVIEGKQSLKLVVDKVGQRSASVWQTFRPVKAKPYKVSFWLKNQGCKIDLSIGNEGPYYILWTQSKAEAQDLAAHPPIGALLGEKETGADTWRQFEYIYDVPKTDRTIRFDLRITQPGTLWIDDVRVQEVQTNGAP